MEDTHPALLVMDRFPPGSPPVPARPPPSTPHPHPRGHQEEGEAAVVQAGGAEDNPTSISSGPRLAQRVSIHL